MREVWTSSAARISKVCVGAVAQLGERLNGIQEVKGSIPFGSMVDWIAEDPEYDGIGLGWRNW